MMVAAALLALPFLYQPVHARAPARAAPAAAIAGRDAHAGARALAAHRATYALTLQSSQDQGVLAARGSMVFEITNVCSGLSTTQHLVIELTDRDGRDQTMVSDYATLESLDGTHLEFHSRELSGDETTDAVDGTAVLDRSGGHGHADYTSPDHKRVILPPGTLLPNAHTLSILRAGATGQRFLAGVLFDGTDANGPQDTFATIEPWQPARSQKWSALSPLPSGRVHIAFFNRDAGSETPDYEVGMRYFDNGVADEMAMNFGDFVMAGRLTQLELKAPPRC